MTEAAYSAASKSLWASFTVPALTKDALDHGGVAQPDGGLEIRKPGHREAGKTKNRTLKILSDWPAERIEQLRAVLRGEQLLSATDAVEIVPLFPMVTCSPRWAPRAGLSLTPCCPAARRNADVIWHSP